MADSDDATEGPLIRLAKVVDRMDDINQARTDRLIECLEEDESGEMCDSWIVDKLDMDAFTVCIVKPDATEKLMGIIDRIDETGFSVFWGALFEFTKAEAAVFYAEHVGRSYFERLIAHMTSDVCVVMLIDANTAPLPQLSTSREVAPLPWKGVPKSFRERVVGPTNPVEAKVEAPRTLRARFGTDLPRNAVHASDSLASARKELAVLQKLMARVGGVRTVKPVSEIV